MALVLRLVWRHDDDVPLCLQDYFQERWSMHICMFGMQYNGWKGSADTACAHFTAASRLQEYF
jgi:hypothetical protein